ncbi:MAG: TonB-dependent receptor [Hyphomonadaceae bacterium]
MKTKWNLGRLLLSGASVAAMGAISSPALAQEDVSDEIVVTATGRAAAIQDVPIAVTAIGGETLENSGVQDLRDITQVATSFSMASGQSQSSGTTARIRGIGTGSDNPGFEAAVGIFIDGVYRARAGAALADLPELVRVEVLRGPQGTLFGRNTSAGAISVVTAGPDFQGGMYIEGSYGFDDLEESGMRAGVDIPLSDSFAFSLDGSLRARDGYINDLISGDDINTRDRWTARAQAVWDISPNASLRVIADAAETDEVCCGITPLFYGPAQSVIFTILGAPSSPGFAGPNTLSTMPVEDRYMTVTPGRGYGEETEDQGISAQLDWEVGGMNFTSISAYRDWSAVRDQDVDFNLIDIAYRDGLEVSFETFTQEFRLQGENGRLNWLVGLFYADEQLRTEDNIRIGAQASIYSNVATVGGVAAAPGTPCGVDGAELYQFFQAAESLFQCATTLLPLVLQGPALAAVNSSNAGYLLPNAPGVGQQGDQWAVDTQSLALFTHNEFSLSDQTTLTVGLRWSQEEKDLTANLTSTGASCTSLQAMENATAAAFAPATGGGGVVTFLQQIGFTTPMNLACNPAVNSIANGPHSGNSDEEEFSGTISLSHRLSDDVMLYGGYSRGYKAGGFNVDRSGFSITPATVNPAAAQVSDLAFDPEFTDAYEIGLKTTILGGTTTFNVTGFYQQITDYQLNAFNGFNYITENVPDVISQGVEIELAARPTDNLTLNGGVVYTDAYYDSTVVFNPLNPGPNTVNSGDPLSLVPEWTVTAGITYEQPLGDNLRALFYLDGRWNDGYRTQTLARNPVTDNDAFAIFNGRIGIGPNDERWAVEFWARNLTDETYYVGAFSPPLQDGTYVVYPNEPRTYGITLRAQY